MINVTQYFFLLIVNDVVTFFHLKRSTSLHKKIFFYPDFGFYPDISGFLSEADYPDKNRIIFLIYPDNGFYPDRNTIIHLSSLYCKFGTLFYISIFAQNCVV